MDLAASFLIIVVKFCYLAHFWQSFSISLINQQISNSAKLPIDFLNQAQISALKCAPHLYFAKH